MGEKEPEIQIYQKLPSLSPADSFTAPPEPSELPAGGCSCLGRAQALGKMELLLINIKNKKISNVFLETESLCNADSWQRARFMMFCVEERFLIADGSLI